MEALNKTKELLRIRKIKSKTNNKMNLLVLRINKSGQLCESAPCYHCTKLLSENNCIQIDKLYYSRSDETITCIKFDDWIKNGTSHISKGWKFLQKSK